MVMSNKNVKKSSTILKRKLSKRDTSKRQRSKISKKYSSKKCLKCNFVNCKCKKSKLLSVHKGGSNGNVTKTNKCFDDLLAILKLYTQKPLTQTQSPLTNTQYNNYIMSLQLFFNHNKILYLHISEEICNMIIEKINKSDITLRYPTESDKLIVSQMITNLLTNSLHYNAVVFRGEYLQSIYNNTQPPYVVPDDFKILNPATPGSNVVNDKDSVNLTTIKWLIDEELQKQNNLASINDIFILGNIANVFHDLGKFITGTGPAPDHPKMGFEELKKICLNINKIDNIITVTVIKPFIILEQYQTDLLTKLLQDDDYKPNPQDWLTKAIILLQTSHDVIAAACSGEASARFPELIFKNPFDKQILFDVIGNEKCANVFWCMTTLNIMADVGTNSPRIIEHFTTGYKNYFDVLKKLCKSDDSMGVGVGVGVGVVVEDLLPEKTKLQQRITLLLNANLDYLTSAEIATNLITYLDTLGKTDFVIGVMDKYFIKGDFMRVIFQEAFVDDKQVLAKPVNTDLENKTSSTILQTQKTRISGLLKFFEILNSVWQKVLPTNFNMDAPNPDITYKLPFKIDNLPERVLIGNQIRCQGKVGDDDINRVRVRLFWHNFSVISDTDSENVKAYLFNQAQRYINLKVKTTLAYDGSYILKNTDTKKTNDVTKNTNDVTKNTTDVTKEITAGATYMYKLCTVVPLINL